MEQAISILSYISILSLFIATVVLAIVVRRFGKSSLGSIFSYLFVGTNTFFIMALFKRYGADTFSMSVGSVEIYWYLLFYLAFIFFFYCLKLLVGMGRAESTGKIVEFGSEMKWVVIGLSALVAIFMLAGKLEPVVQSYVSSTFAAYGLHNYIAAALAGMVGVYLVTAKNTLGLIGKAIANPLTVAIWAIAVGELWNLATNNWSLISVKFIVVEFVAEFLFTIATVSICYATLRLKTFTRG